MEGGNEDASSVVSSSTSIPGPITLSPPGKREVVDKARALQIIAHWREQLLAHRAKVVATSNPAADALPLCDSIVLADKSYTYEAAMEISTFLTSTTEFDPSIASGITVADVSDVIASRMETEGLQVLTSISNAFLSSKLIEVNLSDNAMGSKGITACANLLGGAASISMERLSLCNNGLSEASMGEIAEILTKSDDGSCIAARLTKIHFYNNMSGDGGCTSFGKILDNCSSRLEDIRFSGTRAGAGGSKVVAEALEALASSNDGSSTNKLANLTRLDLADNSFGSCGTTLAKGLSQCTSLVHLNLKDCILSEAGMRSVCSALIEARCPLVHLDLSGNEIVPDVVGSVAALLEDDTIGDSIRYLGLEECEMTSIGVRRIAKALASTGGGGSSVEEINLECNDCGRIGAAALIDSVGTGGLPNLKHIRLDRNMFPSDSMDALATAFGDKLVQMEDNDDEEDVDENLPTEDSADVDELADVLGKTSVQ
eukprot:CAMPEP_0198259400 /NCGR_PEP_ID=MMETSP1447-20131203/8614_1 /TAXON_ID=420782 /ORGANISM="Chaetoceros dichaeta, Strain CCMP1751" /LENGTH=485 /DNA_ID=CAMNT_0043946789 /DNA_START=130 /DNA_END=1587 /DNA_ORIENTATION=-